MKLNKENIVIGLLVIIMLYLLISQIISSLREPSNLPYIAYDSDIEDDRDYDISLIKARDIEVQI